MKTDKTTGIVVFGHGSSVPSANDAVRSVASDAADLGGWTLYETAFLECSPGLDEAVRRLVSLGASSILVLPYFLTPGIHLQRDLPPLAEKLALEFGISILVSPPLDGHPGLAAMLVDRAVEAVQ